MSRLRVHCFSLSFDGYSAGPNQDLANPVGVGGLRSSAGNLPPVPINKCMGRWAGKQGSTAQRTRFLSKRDARHGRQTQIATDPRGEFV
jgi:hypothetical protein